MTVTGRREGERTGHAGGPAYHLVRNPKLSSPAPLRHARRLQTYPKAGDVEAAQGSHRKEGGEERAQHAGGPAYHRVRNPKLSSPAPIRHARRLQTYPKAGDVEAAQRQHHKGEETEHREQVNSCRRLRSPMP
jgi:hypothetical protein